MIVGNFLGEEALAAVGASYALTNVFIMIAIGGGNGASVLTSQYLGARDYARMKTSVFTALISFLTVSLILGGVGYYFNGTVLRALQTPDNIMAQAELYLGIYFLGMPFLFMYNVLAAVFNALGDSKTPLYLLVFSSILNVVMDICSITVLGMGVDGAGGTRIALPSILQQSIVSIGMLLVQSVVNGFGSAVLAGYSAGSRIESICIVPMIATGNAVATFTAQNIGADRIDRVKRGYRISYAIVGAFAALIAFGVGIWNGEIIAAFLGGDTASEAFATGTEYLSFIGWFFVFIGLKACTDGVLRGAGDMAVFTAANLINLGIRVAVAFLLAPVWGVAAVWYAVPMGWTANYLISFAGYLSGKWSRRRVI